MYCIKKYLLSFLLLLYGSSAFGVDIPESLFHKAGSGDIDAKIMMGFIHMANMEYKKALEIFHEIPNTNHPLVQYNLAFFSYNGIVIKKDTLRARELFENTVKNIENKKLKYRKKPLCLYVLANCYNNGYGTPKDTVRALRLYRKAARRGVIYSQFCLGECYYYGKGVKLNTKKAKKWFKKAAKKKYALAQHYFGLCLLGRNTKYNKKAEQYFRLAAEQKYAEAQYTLATYLKKYYNETNTSREEIASLFRSAAEQGHHDAQYALYICYTNGYGVSEDKEKGVEWLHKATLGGHKQKLAQYLLDLYNQNGDEIEKDSLNADDTVQMATGNDPKSIKKAPKTLKTKKETVPDKASRFPLQNNHSKAGETLADVRYKRIITKLCSNPKKVTKKQMNILNITCEKIDTVRSGLYLIGDRCYEVIKK